MADPRLKVIRIKSGMVKRLTKEKSMYISEVEQQKVRVQKYKDEGKDEYEIRKQEEVLQECKMMVPQTHKLLATAFQNLKEILENESDLSEEDLYKTAQAILEEARLAVEESYVL